MKQFKSKRFLSVKNWSSSRRATLVFVVMFAVVGTVLIFATRAATPFASVEPENGTLSRTDLAINDTAASGGKAVKFGTTIDGAYVHEAGKPWQHTFPQKPGLLTPESALTDYTGSCNLTSGTHIIENKIILCTITMPESSTAKLILRNSVIRGNGEAGLLAQGGRVEAEHLLLDGIRQGNEPGIVIEGGGFIRYSESKNLCNPIRVGSATTVEYNLLHNFKFAPYSECHSDGVEVYYGARENGAPATGPHIILKNNFINIRTNDESETGNINITNDFGKIDGVRAEGNTFLPGGSYTLYLRSDGYCGCGGNNENIEIVNNRWFASVANPSGGFYGTHSYKPPVGVTQWTGNTLTRTDGQIVPVDL